MAAEHRENLVYISHRPWRCWLTRRPYVFVDHRPVGGHGEIRALERSGVLDRLVRGEV